MLVLGLVSAANAVLSLSVNGQDPGPEITISPSDTIVLDVSSDNNIAYGAWLLVYDGNRDLANPRTVQGDQSSYLAGHYANYQYYYITIADTQGLLVPGSGFEVDFHCTGPEDVEVVLYDESYTTILDTLVIHQPEPMTIALLGLGGLFLRRRK